MVNRMATLGWTYFIYVYLIFYILYTVFVFYRKKISLFKKVLLLLFIIFIAAIVSMVELGLSGAAKIIFLSLPIIATTFIGLRTSIIIGSLNALILFVFGYLVSHSYWTFPLNFNDYVYSYPSWIGNSITYICFFIITVLIIEKMKRVTDSYLLRIEEQRKELEKVNQTKDKLFSVISHDLKSPFHGLMYMMKEFYENHEKYNKAEQLDIFKHLIDDSKYTYAMIENLLMWSQTQLGSKEIKYQTVHLSELINKSIGSYNTAARAKHISLTHSISPALQLYSDPQSIQIIFSNLINNAVKFTPIDGHISISSKSDDHDIVISVSDTGIGIAPDNIERLFKANDHLSTSGTNDEKGTGLGLGLCNELVTNLNGKIWVSSVKEKGSTFYVSFKKS